MISSIGNVIAAVFRRTSPDPFVLAILLTLVTAGLVMFVPVAQADGAVVSWSIAETIGFWQQGFWDLLTFSMQMCLILVTGHALASSPPVARALRGLAGLPRSSAQAVALVAAVAMGAALVNWGLGLIVGALVARDVGRQLAARNIPHHYPLLAAAGYLGLLVWHGGLSGSAPLKVTNAKDVSEVFAGIEIPFDTIPFSDTVLSGMNIIITAGIVILALIFVVLLTPRRDQHQQSFDQFEVPANRPAEPVVRETIPDWLETTPFLSLLLALPMFIWLADFAVLGTSGGNAIPILPEEAGSSFRSVSPNEVNLLFLALGLVMHGTPRRYLCAVDDAVRGCSGIILQFPIYAGIMGMMKYSGLTGEIARGIADMSTDRTLPVFTLFNAALINLFVPSGGGQWAVQGPIAMQAASDINVPFPKMVMAVAYGDQLTNMLQPFWALPLLGITGVKARDIVGYTAVIMMVAAIWIAFALWLF